MSSVASRFSKRDLFLSFCLPSPVFIRFPSSPSILSFFPLPLVSSLVFRARTSPHHFLSLSLSHPGARSPRRFSSLLSLLRSDVASVGSVAARSDPEQEHPKVEDDLPRRRDLEAHTRHARSHAPKPQKNLLDYLPKVSVPGLHAGIARAGKRRGRRIGKKWTRDVTDRRRPNRDGRRFDISRARARATARV